MTRDLDEFAKHPNGNGQPVDPAADHGGPAGQDGRTGKGLPLCSRMMSRVKKDWIVATS